MRSWNATQEAYPAYLPLHPLKRGLGQSVSLPALSRLKHMKDHAEEPNISLSAGGRAYRALFLPVEICFWIQSKHRSSSAGWRTAAPQDDSRDKGVTRDAKLVSRDLGQF
jgi:hypothetical protein